MLLYPKRLRDRERIGERPSCTIMKDSDWSVSGSKACFFISLREGAHQAVPLPVRLYLQHRLILL